MPPVKRGYPIRLSLDERERAIDNLRVMLSHPDRYKQARGLLADIETGIVYSVFARPIGNGPPDDYVAIGGGSTANGRSTSAHVIVWESANGPIPPELVINHKNGKKSDNRLENLEAVTQSQNQLHAFRTGLNTRPKGESNPGAKLTEWQVLEIRTLHQQGWQRAPLAEKYGVHRSTIELIVSRQTWKHI